MVAIKDIKFPNCCADCNLVELDEIDDFYCGYTNHYCNNQNNERNSDCPLVEIEERKVGKWMLLDECANSGYYCSECHKKLVKEGWSNTVKKINYCPNCGSKISDIERY